MLNKDNYVPWSSRIIRYVRSRPNGKIFVDSIKNGPYIRRMIATPGEPDLPVPVPESFHEQTDEELTENEIKWMDADDQAIQTILLGLHEDVYDAEKKAKLFNEWEKFTSTNGESIESYYHRFMQLMNDLKRNKNFPENVTANLKFLNNLQPKWKRHVTIVSQPKNLHETDFTQIYDFLKINQEEVNELRVERLTKSYDPLALMAHSQNSFNFPTTHKDQSSSSTHSQQSFPINNKYNSQPSFNQNFMQPPMTSLEDINDPTEAMNAALILFAKAFQLSAPTNNNQRTSSNPRNRQIAQLVMNIVAQNQQGYNAWQNGGIQGIANQNGTGNVVAARAEGTRNGNQARCYNCRGLGHIARNCTARPRRRDVAYLQTRLLIAQKEEAGIQLQAEEFDFMATAGDLDEIEEVNANCILMANLKHASTSVSQNDNHVTSVASSMVQSEGTVETSFSPNEETRAHQETVYRNLVNQVSQVNMVNCNMRATNAGLKYELARYKIQEKRIEISQEKYDKLEKCYQKSVYQEQCLTRKINALHLSSAKQITTLNDEISNLNKQLSKEKSFISSLMEEKKRLKHDFNTREDKFLDKEVDLEAKIKDLENIMLKRGSNEEHDPPAMYDSEETLELAQESREKIEIFKEKLESKIIELEFQVVNYERKISHLKTTYKNLFDSISSNWAHAKLYDLIYENAQLRARVFEITSESKKNTLGTSVTPHVDKPKLIAVTPHYNKLHASMPSHSVPQPKEFNVVKHGNVIAPRMFKIYPSQTPRVDLVPNKQSSASIRTNPITNSQRHVIVKENVSSNTVTVSSIGLVHTARTRRPQPKGNTRNDRVPSASKSSEVKKNVTLEDHCRTLLLSKNQKTMSSKCNNIKLAIQNDKSKIVCDTSKQCLDIDLKWGNITITRVYFVEGLGHNLFLVGQFCDADLEVAFRRNTCFIRDLDGVNLLKGNRSTNLYIINLYDMASASPICLMARATPTNVGITHETSATKTPQQNRVIERRNRTLVEAARTIVYNRRTKKIIETMNVTFDELSAMAFEQNSSRPGLQSMSSGQISSELELTYASSTITPQRPSEHDLDILFEPLHNEYLGGRPSAVPRTIHVAPVLHNLQAPTASMSFQDSAPDHPLEQVIGEPSRPVLTRNQLKTDGDMCIYALTISIMEPKSVKEALNNPTWIESMQEELHQFIRLDVWELVSSPDGIKPLTLKWLFKNKHDKENIVIRNKTRLVVRGYRQEEGIDFKEFFAPVARMSRGDHRSKTGPDRLRPDRTETDLVNQSPSGIFVNQSKYVHEILKKKILNTCDIVGTPMDIKDKLNLDQIRTPVDAMKYCSMIGALMYLMSSRPDIIHATCVCARYQAHPTEKHLKEVKRIFRYLQGTVNMGIWYTKDSGFELTGFSDADYARCKDTFKSTSVKPT
uniref:CCHC-type domain-containing protein n=1 Tax=Tanacetum cinerariifolium TaxID=118510 RepID=A0A6L2NN81_TANCI|nr:hypothetical protein [Tanacetum cinerariifolium]